MIHPKKVLTTEDLLFNIGNLETKKQKSRRKKIISARDGNDEEVKIQEYIMKGINEEIKVLKNEIKAIKLKEDGNVEAVP